MGTQYLTVNTHGGGGTQNKQFVKWLGLVDPDLTLASELGERAQPLRDAGYHVLTGRTTRGSKDVGVVAPKDIEHRLWGEDMQRLTKDLNRPIAPDRFYAHMELVRRSIYSLHANAVIQDRKTGGWMDWVVASQWFSAMGKIDKALAADPRPKILGGDMNWNPHRQDGPVKRTPDWLARRHNLDFVTDGVMWFMWDKTVWRCSEREIIDGQTIPTGIGDKHPHNALLVTLERVRH